MICITYLILATIEFRDFIGASFAEWTDFSGDNIKSGADFYNSEFHDKIYFSGNLKGIIIFYYVLFEGKEKVIFDIENLSNMSFMNTDITGVRFSDEARWGGRGEEEAKRAGEKEFRNLD
jgi:hypothetical protein